MNSCEADAAYFKRMHNAIKRARAIVDPVLREAITADLIELDRLHGIGLAERHDAVMYRREVEAALKKP